MMREKSGGTDIRKQEIRRSKGEEDQEDQEIIRIASLEIPLMS
jgi:hypothetical protein